MKQYQLQQFGNSWVLKNTTTHYKNNFKSFEDLTRHINRFRLVDKISGLDALPPFHRQQIGYTSEPTLIQDILLGSGLTNPAIIS